MLPEEREKAMSAIAELNSLSDLVERHGGLFVIDVIWIDDTAKSFDEARRIAHVLRERHSDEGVLVKAEGRRVSCQKV